MCRLAWVDHRSKVYVWEKLTEPLFFLFKSQVFSSVDWVSLHVVRKFVSKRLRADAQGGAWLHSEGERGANTGKDFTET